MKCIPLELEHLNLQQQLVGEDCWMQGKGKENVPTSSDFTVVSHRQVGPSGKASC